jgi:DNA-binding LacI/PurR family transcriptional regulator
MDVKRVARHVQQSPVDAWIVIAGSRGILEWFCEQPMPSYAYFGNKSGLPIAGCGVRNDINALINRLAAAGHRRIVLLTREDHVVPGPSLFSRRFLEALKNVGIEPGAYHLPVWGYRPEGLHSCLESLFKVSPPTALLATEVPIMLATQNHLARRGIIAPRDVSLICHEFDPSFSWCDPQITHYTWDHLPISRHVVRWAKAVSLGRENKRQTVAMARFVENGTIGPAPGWKAG